jgi:hypothetical protein
MQKDIKSVKLSLAPINLDPKSNTAFTLETVSVGDLKSVLTSNNYSNHQWRTGYRSSEHLERTNCIIIDIDKGMSIENARKALRNARINYALITTKSHTSTEHRYRVIIFINRPILTVENYKGIITALRENLFQAWDPNTLDAARFYFASPSDAQYEVWLDGADYNVDVNPETLDMRSFVDGAFSGNLEVTLGDGKVIRVVDLREKTPIYCPFHDDKHASAFYSYSKDSNNNFIRCSSCGKTYWMERKPVPIEDRLNSFWSVGKSIFQFVVQQNEFIPSELGKDKLFVMTKAFEKEDKDKVFAALIKSKHMPALRRVNYLGDPSVEETMFSVSPDEGSVDVRVAPVSARVKDNAFIDKYLVDRFGGEMSQTIKKWMAVYAHSNHQKLPILTVTGKRGCGKNTFAEMIMAMYPSMSQFWRGYLAGFTDEVEKKLLIADEAFSDNPVHYNHLKSLIGASELVVNKKYQTPYQVRNNLNVIILSNSKIPIYVNPEEMPTSVRNNQFLVVDFDHLTGSIDPSLGQKLADRIGYYIRTELKTVYDGLNCDGYRYSIPVPITAAENALFKNNGNEIDTAAAHIANAIESLCININHNPNGGDDITARKFINDHGVIPIKWYQYEIKDHRFEEAKIAKHLVDTGVFKSLERKRIQYQRRRELCYELSERFREQLKIPTEALEIK